MDYPFRGHGPPFLLLIAYLAGVFLALAAGTAWLPVAACSLLASVIFAALRFPPMAAAISVMSLCGALAAGRMAPADPAGVRGFLDGEVVLQGVVSDGKQNDAGWSAVVENARVFHIDGPGSVALGSVLLYVRTPDPPVCQPSEIRATGRLHPINSRGNPWEIPREWSAMAAGVRYVISTDKGRSVFLERQEGCGIESVFQRARNRTSAWLDRHAGRSDGALYMRSLTTGEVPPSSHPLVDLLRKTGLAHLLAISGVNVAIFFTVHSFVVRFALWAIRMRHGTPDLNRTAAILSLPACWAYVLMAGAPIPAVRSAGMITLAVIFWNALGVRRADVCWTLLFFLTIVASPLKVFSPSFLLSYGATFFLIAAFSRRPREPDRPGHAGRILRWGKDALLASAVAFLGTLPVSAFFFSALPSGAIMWNLLFGPVLGTAGVAGAFLAAVGGAFSIDLLGVPVRLAARGLDASLLMLGAVSGDGGGYFILPPSGALAPLFFTAAAVRGTMMLLKRGRNPWPAGLACSLFYLAWIHLPYAALPDRLLTVTALNVGKGASHVVSFPGGGHMVVDCGGAAHGDAGRRILAPHLRGMGIRKIDILVLTHPHEDHYGGAKAILEEFAVGEIWIPEGPPISSFGDAVAQRAPLVRRKWAEEVHRAGGADVIVRGARAAGYPAQPNERGILLELRRGPLSVWLPGDIESGPAAWGEAETPVGGNRVLFLPHHGSPGADPASWIAAARPSIVVSQNRNCFDGKNLLTSAQVFLLENGAFTVQSDGKAIYCSQETSSRIWKLIWRNSEY